MPPADELPPAEPVGAGLAGHCPRCGVGRLFTGYLAVRPRCETCGLDFGFIDTGDGPAFFVSLVAGTIVAGVALWMSVVYDPPLWVYVVVILPLTLVLCIAPLRPLKGLLIALQYRNKAEQGRLGS